MAIATFKVIQDHRSLYQSKAHMDFLLAINSTLPPILHRFQVMVQFSLSIEGYLTLTPSLGWSLRISG